MSDEFEMPLVINAETTLDQLEREIWWDEAFRLIFVKCNHPAEQEARRCALLERLDEVRVLEIALDKPMVSLLDEINRCWNVDEPPDVVCVYGLHKAVGGQEEAKSVLGRMNHDRELIRGAVPAPLLIWLPDFALDQVAQAAPDFWALRAGVCEFPANQEIWEGDTIAVFGRDDIALLTLSLQERLKEVRQLEQLLQPVQSLSKEDERMQAVNARLLNRLGMLYSIVGRPQEALANCEESLAVLRAIGDRTGEGRLLNNIGKVYNAKGEHGTALQYLQESLAIGRTVGDRVGEGTVLHNIGEVYGAQGDYGKALPYMQESLAIRRAVGDRVGEAVTLTAIGAMYHAQGDYGAVLPYWQEALAIHRAIGDRAAEGATLNNLAQLYKVQGDYDAALRYLQESVVIGRAGGEQPGLCVAQFNIARMYLEKQELEPALTAFAAAYKIAKAVGHAQVLHGLDDLAKQIGGGGLEFWEMLAKWMPSEEESQ
jgi:tetratricopeptide (TPR) repeat protein